MLGNIQKSIILRALKIRMDQGENPKEILESYAKLTEEEKKEILKIIEGK